MITPAKSYLDKFRILLRVVLQTNEFYKRKFKAAGIVSADQITTWSEFYALPFTTRAELIKDQQRRPPFGTNLTRSLSQYSYVIRTSGTSTGIPFYQPLTSEEFDHFAEVLAQGYKEMGIKRGDVICYLSSSYAYPLFYEASRRLGARMVPVDNYKSLDVLKMLKSMNVAILQSFPTAVFELIELAQDKHIDLKRLGIKIILTIGEVGGGFPPTKSFFKDAWNAKVIDHIGAMESGTFAIECAKGNTYHILEKLFISEVYEPSTNRPSIKGELVLTSLWRRDYPLIRFRTGDVIEIDNLPCPCGKAAPRLIGGILGRATGQVKLRSLFMFPEDIERTIRLHREVKEFQIICRKENDIDTVDIYIELSLLTKWDELNVLMKDLQETLGFQPNLYPVLPKSLPRFGPKKGSRFHDYRFISGKPSFPVGFGRKLMARPLVYLFTWNNRKRYIRQYFSFVRNIIKGG